MTRLPPLSLQTRLMAAVIGFVSLILVVVAVITSATLGRTLEQQLDERLHNTAAQMTAYVAQQIGNAQTSFYGGGIGELTASDIAGNISPQSAGLLIVMARDPDLRVSGAVVGTAADVTLTAAQLRAVEEVATSTGDRTTPTSTVSVPDLGSYRITVTETKNGVTIITGLPRAEIQSNLTSLFTVIAMATLGGLILLALTTAITIRVSLRPLRAVAATATRVANRQLDRGAVSITERVPAAEADARTETGLVGAALNTLLDHVDASLSARQHNEERMRRFVADASHELRTPLASIRGYSELSLRERELPETTYTALERIQAQSLRMTRLVEDLLLLARLDEGRELVYGTVDLTQLGVEGIADARPTAPDHQWNLVVPEEPVVVVGDAGRLHQVVTNLLANARTHTPAGTAITLTVRSEGNNGILSVHDDGPGIDPAVREELFARFARGDASRARQTGGTGLGLAIVKAIVDGHQGEILVDSEPGATTFTVRIPANPASGA